MELLKALLKYFLEGLAVAVVTKFIPKGDVSIQEVLLIALTSSVTFFILDMFSPSIGKSARTGAGFGIGAKKVGFVENYSDLDNPEEIDY